MKRRDFTKMVAGGVAAATIPTAAAAAAAASARDLAAVRAKSSVKRSHRKEWAREHFKGFENIFLPSYLPNSAEFDEEGIRLDVRQAAAHGFFSTFVSAGGADMAQRKRLLDIVTDEAKGKILVSTGAWAPTVAESIAWLQYAESRGVEHALVGLPRTGFQTEDELYEYVATIAEATDVGIVVYAVDGEAYRQFHPANVPFRVFDRLADLPNVVAMKVMTTLDLPTTMGLYELLNERILVGTVNFSFTPMLVKFYDMQWSGAWTVEALQSPEKPYFVEMMRLLQQGKTEKALQIYWKITPAIKALYNLMAPLLPRGLHPWPHLKFYQYLVGGNGSIGPVREDMGHTFTLTAEERQSFRDAYRAIGIEPAMNDEEFLVGRAAYARGSRAKDVLPNSQWQA